MIFSIIEKKYSNDSCLYILKTDKKNLVFIGYILESFEGFSSFTTINRKESIVEIACSKDFENDINLILEELKKDIY